MHTVIVTIRSYLTTLNWYLFTISRRFVPAQFNTLLRFRVTSLQNIHVFIECTLNAFIFIIHYSNVYLTITRYTKKWDDIFL